jgi:hypothetical protein
MMEQSQGPARWRVAISTTSKGLPSWEVTLDGQNSGLTFEEVEAQVAAAAKALSERYPAEVPLQSDLEG